MGLRADSARPQRVRGSARTDSQRTESARNPIASHVNFGGDSALSAFTRTQWTAALRRRAAASSQPSLSRRRRRWTLTASSDVSGCCRGAVRVLCGCCRGIMWVLTCRGAVTQPIIPSSELRVRQRSVSNIVDSEDLPLETRAARHTAHRQLTGRTPDDSRRFVQCASSPYGN